MTARQVRAGIRATARMPDGWRAVAIVAIAISPIPAFLFSMLLGSFGLSVGDVLGVIWSRLAGTQEYSGTTYAVLFDIRLPRVITAMLVGMSISVAGAVLQGVLRNCRGLHPGPRRARRSAPRSRSR
ncbi:MAG: iron chelate uptake ABC transporter family permease subunit [Chloroflexota bacterium]